MPDQSPAPRIERSNLPMVALVGRANVGKSTLWNKLVEERRALVSAEPHTTRDRNIAEALWRGRAFEVVDTGGLDTEEDEMGRGILRQSERAIREADLALFVVDGKTGVLDLDRRIAKQVRKLNPNVLLVVNKIDKQRDEAIVHERALAGLGLGVPVPVSASTGKRVGDLLDAVYERLEAIGRQPPEAAKVSGRASGIGGRASRRIPKKKSADGSLTTTDTGPLDGRPTDTRQEPAPTCLPARQGGAEGTTDTRPLRLVLMGRPNVGKSSLTNAILGEERVIVSPVAHTTREPQDTPFAYRGREMVIVDTAGMRKRARVDRGLEEEGLDKNREALDRADVALLVFDATEDPRNQDKRLAGLMEGADKGLILVANKWDLVESKTTKSADAYEGLIRQAFPFLKWAPIVFVSAKTGQRAQSLLDLVLKIEDERHRKIDYNALNKFLKTVLKQKRPLASYGPKSPYIHDVAQVGSAPPKFLVTVRGEKQNIHPSWLKFFEKRLRDKFGFEGTPVVVIAQNIPIAKSERARYVRGPGMEAVAGKIKEKWMTAKKKNVRWRR